MTDQGDLDGLLGRLGDDRALLLSVCEQLAPSMNGFSARRLAMTLEDVQRGVFPFDESDRKWLTEGLQAAARHDRLRRWQGEVAKLADDGVKVVASFDPDYPVNLSMIHDRPPVLFVRGSIRRRDVRAVSVVGTRSASASGRRLATDIASELAARGLTIVSGLARGIDTAAHAAAINAGGRTIAVFGTAICKVYPTSNRALARAVSASGACVSQFLPTRPTGPWCFLVRNATTSGLSVGTVVIEAQAESGAKHQAEAALSHGKRVFLVEEMVTRHRWATRMAQNPRVTVAPDASTIVNAVDAELAPADAVLL